MAVAGTVLYEQLDGVARVTINRPDALNALNFETMDSLRGALQRASADPDVRALVLTGAGDRAFVSGGDLKEFRDLKTAADATAMIVRGKALTRAIAELRFPTIAAVNGYALGGGCEVAVACDFRIASSAARLGFRQVKLGLISGWGGGPRLIRLLGHQRALRLMLTGDTLDAEEARRVGLVDEVASPEELLPAAHRFARSLSANAPLAIAAYKRLAGVAAASLEAASDLETELFGPVWVTEDHDEAVRAHFEKRRPRFVGR